MSKPRQPPSRPTAKPPIGHRSLHRFTGVCAGGVLLYLVATGLPLQYTDQLALGTRFVEQGWILDYYGLHPPIEATKSGDAVSIGGQLYWRGNLLGELNGFSGSVLHGDLAVVAARDMLLLFPPDAPELADQLPLSGTLSKIGQADGFLQLELNGQVRRMDAGLLNLLPIETTRSVRWAPVEALPVSELGHYQQAFRRHLLSLERLLQDLHSGRAFGPIGVIVINLATLAMVALSITGLLIWWRTRS